MTRSAGDAADVVEAPARRKVVVTFRVADQAYALPLDAVVQVLPMVAVAPLPQAPPIVLGVINLHGQIVPVIDIRRRAGRPPREYGLKGHVLVVRTPRRTLALPVDAVVGTCELPADAIVAPAALLPGVGQLAGVATLSEEVIFIYDLDAFLSLEEEARLTSALAKTDEAV
jgi:purine-binding chemotaxis protein CheW